MNCVADELSANGAVTSPLSNTFDNSGMDARNSFHWNRRQFSALNTNFQATLNFNDLTVGDYLLAQLSHWLRGSCGFVDAYDPIVNETMSLSRAPSPNGTIEGKKTWIDHADKWWAASYRPSTAGVRLPLFVAYVLPDGTSAYTYSARNNWGGHPMGSNLDIRYI